MLPKSNINMTEITFSAKEAEAQLVVELDPLVNRTFGPFFKIGTVVAAKAAARETQKAVRRGNVTHDDFKHSLKKICEEGAYWGTAAGVFGGMEYGVERVRGTKDWKNAMIGGALTGALVSAACRNDRDKIVMDAITGGAVATAARFLGK